MTARTGTPHGSHNRLQRPDWSWQEEAWGRGKGLGLFFGPDGERQPERDVRERKAKKICDGCPVRRECLDFALSRPEKYGLYGGLSEDERASERRRRMRRASYGNRPDSRGDGTPVEDPSPVEAAS